jgi:hypothetical protein
MKMAPLAVAVVALLVFVIPAAASSNPSGQRTFGQSVLEPVYNAEDAGAIGYIKQPTKAPQPVPSNPKAWSPFYLVVYPVTSTVPSTVTLFCRHTPAPENCPTHGNAISGLALAQEPSVYGAGVAGHDHLMDFPGGDDFNIAWEPMVVLFTAKGVTDGTVNQHLVTDAQVDAAVNNQDAIVVPLPQRTFLCASVPESLYDRSTPLTP